MHTPLCGHAIGLPVDYVEAARQRGIQLMTFTCHIPMEADRFGGPHIRMAEDQLPLYLELTQSAKAVGRDYDIEVLVGIEAEVFPDEEPLEAMDAILQRYGFDFVLGSLHHQCPGYQQRIYQHPQYGNDFGIVEQYFQDLTQGVLSNRYDSMSHPDVIRIYGTVQHFNPADHEPTIRSFLQAMLDTDTCMEVNTSGLIKGVYQVHPDPLILGWAAEMGIKLTIGSDAHTPQQVGQKFDEVYPLLYSKGFSDIHYFKNRVRHSLPLLPNGGG